MSYRAILILVLMPLMAAPVQAGIIFGRKKDRPDPRLRVPELVVILRTSKDADKRARAAEELRNYDPTVFSDIVPVLIEAMQQDKKPGVRIEAVHSLSKLRPVSVPVGEALEQALARDPSMRVRLQARSALLQYHWAGFRSKKNEVPPLGTSREPPMAGPTSYPPPLNTKPPPQQAPSVPIPTDPYRLRPVPDPTPAPTSPAPKANPPATREGPDLDGPALP